jgi:uncharacterized repeat protein (TIGR04138 family)
VLEDPIEAIVTRDPRFRSEAYQFVHDALIVTQSEMNPRRHITGRELAEGIRRLALDRYGRLAKTVLNSWGIRTTLDFGTVVFNMVEAGLMSKTETDTVEDFRDVYDFDTAFIRSYELGGKPPAA